MVIFHGMSLYWNLQGSILWGRGMQKIQYDRELQECSTWAYTVQHFHKNMGLLPKYDTFTYIFKADNN
jgi:hypothetical protein